MIAILTNQEIPIAVVESRVIHRHIAGVYMHCKTMTRSGIASTTNRVQTFYKVYSLTIFWWQIKGFPAKLSQGIYIKCR